MRAWKNIIKVLTEAIEEEYPEEGKNVPYFLEQFAAEMIVEER
jgi:hypothetical protein